MSNPILVPSPFVYGQIQDGCILGQIYMSSNSPTVNDRLNSSTIWINNTSGRSWILNGYISGIPNWVLFGGGAGDILTLEGNSGGMIEPASNGNLFVVGTGSIVLSGNSSTNTLTAELSGLTNHSVLVGAGTATITNVGPTSTAGQVLQSSGSSADPAFSTATYPSTVTANEILYASAGNVVGQISTVANGVLVTNNSDVPSFLPNGTAGYVLTSNSGAPPSWEPVSEEGAITTIDGDTGSMTPTAGVVTISGGSTGLSTSASSSTMDLTGTLVLANGGTGDNLTASHGGIFYSTASAGAILAGTATASQVLLSGASTTPSWSTATYPSTTTVNQILYSSSANTVSGLSTTNNGILITGTTGIPSMLADGTTGQVLTATTGSPPSWENPAIPSSITVTSTSSNSTFYPTLINNDITGTYSLDVASTFQFNPAAGLSVTGYLESSTLTASAPVIANSSKQLISTALTNGQLLIGNTGIVPSAATLTPSNGFSVANSTGSITLSNLRNGARYVVSEVSGQGGYITIGAAITQAISDGASSTTPATILVWEGTYRENLTLSDYVNICSIGNSVTVVGNATYSSGTGTVYLQNITFSTSNSSPAISITAGATVYFSGCSIKSSSSGSSLSVDNIAASVQLNSCNILATNLGAPFTVTDATVTLYGSNISASTTVSASGSSSSGEAIVTLIGCKVSDFFTINDTATIELSYSSMVATLASGAVSSYSSVTLVGGSAIFASIGCDINCTAPYLVNGSSGGGIYEYCDTIITGTTSAIEGSVTTLPSPWIGGNLIVPSLQTNTLITAPSNSASSSLSLGSAYQNTLGYDVILIVYLSITSATSATILSGVGSTNTPSQQTIVSSITVAAQTIIPVTVYLPNNYYTKISTSGTITASISGQQVTPV